MKKFYSLLMVAVLSVSAFGQTNIVLQLNHLLGTEPFAYDVQAENNLGQSFSVSRLEYYMSGFEIVHDGGQVTAFPDTYLLVRGDDDGQYELGAGDITSIEGIRFHIGVESPTNNEDPASWPEDHPLYYQNPSMHWGWSSGYRFAVLEGDAGSNLSIGFELHALWNENYFEQSHPVQGISVGGNTQVIELNADYSKALQAIDVAAGPIQHGTNQNDLTLLQNFRNLVFQPAGGSVNVPELGTPETSLYLWPNPTAGEFRIALPDGEKFQVVVTDMMGRETSSFQIRPNEPLRVELPGCYLVRVLDEFGNSVGSPIRLVVG